MYLIKERPRFTIKLVLLFLLVEIILITVSLFSEVNVDSFLVLHPSNLSEPQSWYRFFTYPLVNAGLFGWLRVSFMLILAGYILERRTSTKNLQRIFLLSIVLGGLLYCIGSTGDELDRPVASTGLLAWGYWSATLVCALKTWNSLKIGEKIIVGLFLLSILGIEENHTGFFIAQIGVIFFVAILSLSLKFFEKPRLAPSI